VLDLLVVDDEPTILLSIADALRDAGHRVVTASDGEKALAGLSLQSFDAVICDVRLPKVDGLTLLREVRKSSAQSDVILMTGHANANDAVAALKSGATDYLTKPFSLDELLVRVSRIANERALKKELMLAKQRAAEGTGEKVMVGTSAVVTRLNDFITKYAASDAPVLITGESGTGKELVAAALHRQSDRRDKPFVPVSCAAFPDTLLEAELFGHERGAFTGAVKRRDGRFKVANGGVLFLDEVGEVPLASQAKLLRVLQEQVFEPLGTSESLRVDVRIISATHRNLKEMVAAGTFREDLYYRLKILDLEVPSLRERQGDLPLLVSHFLLKCAPRPLTVTASAMAALEAHSFPGNVRELEHAVRRAVALVGDSPYVEMTHLPKEIVGNSVPKLEGARGRSLADAVKEFEHDFISASLRHHRGSKTRTAEALGISRKNLWEKLRRHGLVGSEPDEEMAKAHHDS
jgi:two-component system, NtrC family, response regulator AtoC